MGSASTDLTGTIARMVERVSALDVANLSDATRVLYAHVVADCVAVAAGGFREPEMVELVGNAQRMGVLGTGDHHGRARLWNDTGVAGAAPDVAFLNATAGCFLELDEGMRPLGHAGMHVVPAALAAGEAIGASGRRVFHAIVLGYEVTGRLLSSIRLRSPAHPHGHMGAAGAAVAVSLLTDADPVEAALIALTTPVLSVWDACYDGATARNTFMAHAARTGVYSALMSKSRFTGSPSGIAAVFDGMLATLKPNWRALDRPIDHEDLCVHHNYFKQHSACALTHAAIDAAREIHVPHGAKITSVTVETVRNNMKMARLPEPNSLSTRFSLPYAVATALRTGRADPAAFAVDEPTMRLAERVDVAEDSGLEAMWPERWPARVTVRWDGGETSAETLDAHGSGDARLSGTELRAKFDSLVGEGSDVLWERILGMADSDGPVSVLV